MKLLVRVVLVVLLAFLGFVAGAAIGARFAAEGTGMAGGATVFLSGLIGVASLSTAGAIVARRLSGKALWIALLVAVAGAALAVVWIGSRMSATQTAVREDGKALAGAVAFAEPRGSALPAGNHAVRLRTIAGDSAAGFIR